MRGADCSTDHNMVKTTTTFSIKKRSIKTCAKPPIKLNVTKLKNKENQQKFEEHMDKIMDNLRQPETGIEDKWNTLKSVTFDTATDILGRPERKRHD